MKNVYVRLVCLVKSPIAQGHFSSKKLLVSLKHNGNKPPYYYCNILEHFMDMHNNSYKCVSIKCMLEAV